MSKPDEREVRDLAQQLSAGRLSRREFVTRASALGLSIGAIGSLVAACGGDDDEAAAPPAEPAPAEPPAEPPAGETGAAPPATGPSGASDEIAVEAAKQFSGTTLNVTWESGLQANDPKLVWGPEWEELTGIKINVVELDYPDLFTKGLQEHIAGSGAHDILTITPAWIADFVAAGAIVPIDEWMAEYLNPADLEDFHPLYKGMSIRDGQNWGFFDDGDTFVLYYRKDIFEEMGLQPPTTYDEWIATAQQITDERAPEVYGADFWRNSVDPAMVVPAAVPGPGRRVVRSRRAWSRRSTTRSASGRWSRFSRRTGRRPPASSSATPCWCSRPGCRATPRRCTGGRLPAGGRPGTAAPARKGSTSSPSRPSWTRLGTPTSRAAAGTPEASSAASQRTRRTRRPPT